VARAVTLAVLATPKTFAVPARYRTVESIASAREGAGASALRVPRMRESVSASPVARLRVIDRSIDLFEISERIEAGSRAVVHLESSNPCDRRLTVANFFPEEAEERPRLVTSRRSSRAFSHDFSQRERVDARYQA